MTSAREHALALKRQHLQRLCRVQRSDLCAQVAQTFGPAIGLVNTAQLGALWLRQHPALLLAGASVLMVWRPRNVLSWARKGLAAWVMLQKIQPWLSAASTHGKALN